MIERVIEINNKFMDYDGFFLWLFYRLLFKNLLAVGIFSVFELVAGKYSYCACELTYEPASETLLGK